MSLSRILANIGTALDSATTGDFLSKVDSDGVFGGVAYSSVTGTPTVLDSANVTNLIDSSYVQLRQSAVASGGLDSAGVTAILDSDYITNITTASGFQMFEYDATAGQTEFTGSDVNGNTLAYSEYGLLVHYNGILLSGATDYTATDGTTVVLTDSADADARITIAKWSLASAGGGAGGASFTWGGDRGVASGFSRSPYSTADYFDITTPGNASDWGDLYSSYAYRAGVSSGTYGVWSGGTPSYVNNIDYITIASLNTSANFGSLTVSRRSHAGAGDGTYGLYMGGDTGSESNVIDYITIASPSNATDFGDIVTSRKGVAGTEDTTYGVIGGGNTGSDVNTIEYVTISTPSNSTDFGDLTVARRELAGGGNGTYGIFAGGEYYNTIDYITIASPSNATDFGDLQAAGNGGDITSGSPS